MANQVLYMKLDQKVEITQEDVFLKDIGKFVCNDTNLLNKVKAMKIYSFRKGKPLRQVIGVLKIVEMLQGIAPNIEVVNLGETDVILEQIQSVHQQNKMRFWKILLVALVCFFGTFFTIMAFHNDIGINKMFGSLYQLITGQASDGFTVLEVFYSIGLATGIIVFFNHIGPRRITKDPTPVEVEMRLYEDDVNTSLIETSGREGKTIDVN